MSKKLTVSFVKGKGSINHNNREFVTNNVDVSRIKDNITYKNETLEQAYDICFGQALEEYNSKQKRSDRKKNNYIEYIKNSKNNEKLFYENLVQVGNMFDSHVGTEQGEINKLILDRYAKEFQERNPNLYLFNAVMHLDEKTPHLHLCYIPLGHGYKQGMKVRNSLDRAYKEQGIDGKANKYENSTHAWQDREKAYIAEIMREYGLERAPDKGLKQKHLTIDQYKATAERIHAEVKQMPKQIESAEMMLNKERVTVKKSDLQALEKRAKLSVVHEKATKELISKTKEEYEKSQKFINTKMCAALYNEQKSEKALRQIEIEFSKAMNLRLEAEKMVEEQQEINERYESLCDAFEEQKKTIEELNIKNHSLEAEIDDLRQECDRRVQQKVEPLQRQMRGYEEKISDLEEKNDTICQCLTNVVKAFGMLKHDKQEGYRILNLNDKQNRLFDAIEKYTTKWLRKVDKDDMALEVENSIGISKGIRTFIKELISKNRNTDKGR